MPDPVPDNFGTLFPGNPPAPPKPEATQGASGHDTDPVKTDPDLSAGNEATMRWTGPSAFDSPFDEVAKKIIDLGIVRKDQWEAAVKAVGNSADVPGILRALRKVPSHREIRGEPGQPALTDFQLQQILSGNIDRLRFHHHLILDRLGKGGMGEVFKVWNMNLQRPEAIKTVLSEYSSGETAGATHARDRFEREARVLAQLDHPCITTIYQFGREHNVDFLAMEYIRGRDMKSIVEEAEADGEEIPVWWAAERVSAIAEALQHAHEMGVIHRDIKPSNIMITENEELKVLDMGIARLVSPKGGDLGTTRLTQAAVGLGTPEVMSPEQWADATAVTPESDIYSLGCTFFYVLTGRMPFKADNLNGLMFAHVNDIPPRVSTLRADVPKGLDDIVAKMLEKEPADRFRSCRELVEALKPYIDPEPHSVRAGGSKLPIAIASLAIIVVLLGAVALAPFVFRDDGSKPTTTTDSQEIWPDRVENALLKHQMEHRDIWPSVADLENWVKTRNLVVGSQKSLDEFIDTMRQETADREKLRGQNMDRLSELYGQNTLVWPNEDALRQQVSSEIDPALFSNPAKEEELKSKLAALNAKAYRQHMTDYVAKLQSEHKETWSSSERLMQEVTDLDDIDTPTELEAAKAKLERSTWQQQGIMWANEYEQTHQMLWDTANDIDVLQVMDRILKDGADRNTFEKAQQAVREESQKLIGYWVAAYLEDFQKKHSDVWPTAMGLADVAHVEIPLRSLSDYQSPTDQPDDFGSDAYLKDFMAKVEDLTEALQRPFDHVVLKKTGDDAVDKDIESLLTVYRMLLDALANQQREPKELASINFDAYVAGQRTPVIPASETYSWQIASDRPGYLTVLTYGSDGMAYLLQWKGELDDQQQTLMRAQAQTAGTDRLIAYLTSENPLDECASVPNETRSEGSLQSRAHRVFLDGKEEKEGAIPMELAKRCFPYGEIWNRIENSLMLGQPMPGYKPTTDNRLIGRKSIDVRVEGE